MKVKLIVDGGKMQPGPAVSQQLGPMGINLGKVISSVNDSTKGFAGMKVPVEIEVNSKTKEFTIHVFSPPVAELIKKELGLEKGSGQPNKVKVGNIAFERIVSIAQTKLPGLLAKDLRAAVKLIVGTCVSLGVLIDNKEAKEIERSIESGTYDNEIDNQITEVSSEKKTDLDKFFAVRKAQQEKEAKALEEAKAAEEAAKAAAAAVPGATPAATDATKKTAGAKPEAGKEAVKTEVKKEEPKKAEGKKK
ncbi:MAG: 50S ribosomal protein L11 [Nanoarchaeota archaeon]